LLNIFLYGSIQQNSHLPYPMNILSPSFLILAVASGYLFAVYRALGLIRRIDQLRSLKEPVRDISLRLS